MADSNKCKDLELGFGRGHDNPALDIGDDDEVASAKAAAATNYGTMNSVVDVLAPDEFEDLEHPDKNSFMGKVDRAAEAGAKFAERNWNLIGKCTHCLCPNMH